MSMRALLSLVAFAVLLAVLAACSAQAQDFGRVASAATHRQC